MAHDTRIVTLTLNPSIDLGCEAESIQPTRKIRTFGETYDPGGGGVNVARVLGELGGETLAVVTTGGVVGRFLEELLEAAGVPCRAVPIAGRTRISQVVQDRASGLEYRFVPEGPALAEAEWRAALAMLAAQDAGWLVLSGSLPRGVPEDFYAHAIRDARRDGRRVVLDTSGAALRAGLAAGGIEVVKPSLGEFEGLLGRRLNDDLDAITAAALEVASSGAARLVAVTLGHRGAVLAGADGSSWRLPAPEVEVRGATGAGDSFVAAMTWALARGDDAPDAFAWGSAAGGATVAATGTAHARRAEIDALYAAMRPHLG